MIHLEDATIEHLEARLDELEKFGDDSENTLGNAKFPIHDAYSSDDPDAEWNSIAAIEAELARRF